MVRPPPRSTRTDALFPYTTLFRSVGRNAGRSTAFEAPSIGPAPVATNVTRSCHADVIDLHLKGRTIVMKDRPMRAVLIAAPLLVLAIPAPAQTDTDSQVWTDRKSTRLNASH